VISQKDNSSYQASLFLDVTEYGSIIQLWSDGSGIAQVEIPNDFYAVVTLKPLGTLLGLHGLSRESGHYSPISRSLTVNLGNGREFNGSCKKRKD